MTSLLPYSPAEDWAAKISAAWRRSIDGILEAGRLITESRKHLADGQFTVMVESALPFDRSTAFRLERIAADPKLVAHVQHLPPHWGTLYELTKLDEAQFEAKIADGTINPKMERRDITGVIKTEKRTARERDLATKITILPTKRYGVILADPPWSFAPYSRKTGMDRAADNHYPTQSVEDICKLDVPSIAAPDCVLFLWATVPMLPQALDVMRAWGFEYKSHACWAKKTAAGVAIGTGYWFRNSHELLLVGTRGKIPAPAPGAQWHSVIEEVAGRHSAKPEVSYRMIEGYFPNLPKIELNSRRARPGWDAWGNETAGSVSVPVSDGATLIDKNTNEPARDLRDYEPIPQFLRRY